MSDEDVGGGLDEILPDPLVPLYEQYLKVEAFRAKHGETYTGIMEAIVAVVLVGGYIYWLYLLFVAG